ncbi:MCE family protein [Actinomycetes bacterium M1A6_2h]
MRLAALVIALVVLLTGCGWRGLNSLPLPGTEGSGDGAYSVTIEMPDVSTIERNSRVLVADVTVGRVSDIRLEDGHAVVTVAVNADVDLPANATAKVGQTSLLGSTHIELAAPVTEPATGRLTDGSIIPLARAGTYPTTEQTLSTLSLVLSGGGLSQVQEITTELDAALGGRTDAVRSLLDRLNTLLTSLDEQKNDIVRAIDGLDRFAAEVSDQNLVLDGAVRRITPALGVLADSRGSLTTALTSLGRLGDTATALVGATGDDLIANLQDLRPVLKSLADAGPALTESLRYLLTYPFPIDTYANAVRGDYANGEVTLDLRLNTIDNALLLGTPLAGSLAGIEGAIGQPAPFPAPTVPTVPDLLLPPFVGGTP